MNSVKNATNCDDRRYVTAANRRASLTGWKQEAFEMNRVTDMSNVLRQVEYSLSVQWP